MHTQTECKIKKDSYSFCCHVPFGANFLVTLFWLFVVLNCWCTFICTLQFRPRKCVFTYNESSVLFFFLSGINYTSFRPLLRRIRQGRTQLAFENWVSTKSLLLLPWQSAYYQSIWILSVTVNTHCREERGSTISGRGPLTTVPPVDTIIN